MKSLFGPHEDISALALLERQGGALCTLVGIEGGYSRGLGSHLAVSPSGALRGTLADGCLEAELVSQVRRAGPRGQVMQLRYGAGSPFIDFQLPCGAGIDILISPALPTDALSDTLRGLAARRSATLELGRGFVRHFRPALRLLVVGATADATALAQLAQTLGIEVDLRLPGQGIALGKRPAGIEVDRFTAIISLFHDHEWERAILPWALATDAFYVGSIGGVEARRRRDLMLEDGGLAAAACKRLHSPIGLVPAAKDPATLAVSIMAEVLMAYRALTEGLGPAVEHVAPAAGPQGDAARNKSFIREKEGRAGRASGPDPSIKE